MLTKNQKAEVLIESCTPEGYGVCRLEGRAVFVSSALEGERWEILILKEGTYTDYQDYLRNKGVVLNQIKPVTVINTPERKDFFFSHVVTEDSSAVTEWKESQK